ncbi:acyl-CoA thioester hydrolase, YbgC/YbaW family [Chromobacterium violaceum]|uniref:Acyl-CoA thioester hydrolase, YbgC/YbaW family n=1 Tax=Chromobacterium violaceum TaxID=536 RepID=A0A447TC37_CHRVL|nr:acyl-CoA thioester hydrolase, YbgC/YbaW family [Chromobacterium violaceum]
MLELTEQVLAALLITARQGVELRGEIAELSLSPALARMQRDLADRIPRIAEDRALDKELIALIGAIRAAPGACMTKLSHVIELEPAFHDLDPMDVVWHGNYVKYLEIARCALLERFDYNYRKCATPATPGPSSTCG